MNEQFFETIISPEDYIYGNGFINFSNGPTQFCKTDFISDFKDKEIKYFITHNSDYEINDHALRYGPKFDKWYCQNKNINHERIFSIPIGLENFEPDFSFKSQFGRFSSLPSNGPYKKEYISNLSSKIKEHKNLIYSNFSTATFPSERNHVKNMFIDKKWVTKEENVDWKMYYDSIADSKFCFSPRGNGIDCHRTWEALYLRTIPIVKKSICMNDFLDLPILFIDDWSEITEQFLQEKYEHMKNNMYNLEKLRMSYWKKIIAGEL